MLSNPAGFLEFLSGKASASEPAYNHPSEEGPKIVENRVALGRLVDSIEMFGLFDADRMYDELHENWLFLGMDLPCPNQLVIAPDRMDKDDPRRFWINEKAGKDLIELRENFQQLIVQAFAAGMEFQSNLHREELRRERKQRGGVIKKGQKVKAHTQVLRQVIDLWLQSNERADIGDLTSKKLEEFILNGPLPKEWRIILKGKLAEVRAKAKEREALQGPPKNLENPGLQLLKNALSSYRSALKKKG